MKKIAILVVGLVLVAAACNKNNPPVVNVDVNTPADNNSQPGSNNNNSGNPLVDVNVSKTYEIKMTNNGFEPSTLTINKGDTVKFVNNDDTNRWPASAPHPTHTDYPEFDAKKGILAGSSWSFTFDRTGAWKFHDHLIPTMFGTVTVK